MVLVRQRSRLFGGQGKGDCCVGSALPLYEEPLLQPRSALPVGYEAILGSAYRSCCTRTITYPACFVNDTTRVPATQKKVAATLKGVTFSFSKQIENKKTRTGAVWYKAVFPATAVCANDKYLVDGRNVSKQRVSIHELSDCSDKGCWVGIRSLLRLPPWVRACANARVCASANRAHVF